MKINSTTKIILQSFLILVLFGLSVKALAVWTAPSATPPAGNIAPPVNSGGATQQKSGGLVVGFFRSMGITILDDEVTISAGDPQAGKVLTAVDSTGLVSWEDASGGVPTNANNGDTLRYNAGAWVANNVLANDGSKVSVTGNFEIPNTTSSTVGVLMKGGSRFLHDYTNSVSGQHTNIFLGQDAGNFTTSGPGQNNGIGYESLKNITSGYYNNALGTFSLGSNTTGSGNVAIGNSALAGNTTGGGNIAIGSSAGQYLANGFTARSTGTDAIYLGHSTKASANGLNNEIVIGHDAIGAGSNSITLGNNSVSLLKIRGVSYTWPSAQGGANTVLTNNGSGTLSWSTSGGVSSTGTANYIPRFSPNGNSLANSSMFQDPTTGDIGINTTTPAAKLGVNGNVNVAGNVTVTGTDKKLISESTFGSTTNWTALWVGTDLGIFQYPQNLKFGIQAGSSPADNGTNRFSMMSFGSSRNTMFGDMLVSQSDPGSRVTIKGASSGGILNVIRSNDESVLYVSSGGYVGIGTTSPTKKLHVSEDALINGITVGVGAGAGSGNTAAGYLALNSNNNGTNNTAVGAFALRYQSTGSNNTAHGWGALNSVTSGGYNTAQGANALANTTGSYNTAVGVEAGRYAFLGNTGLGYQALKSNSGGSNATYNTAVGYQALVNNANNGHYNTAMGYRALDSNTSGQYNVAVGVDALTNVSTSGFNVGIGYNAGPSGNGYNTIAIGWNAVPQSDQDAIALGNDNIDSAWVKVPWTTGSDRRYKKDITDLDLGLDFVLSLRPVSYKLKEATDDAESFGFIAQEVEEALNGRSTKLVTTGNDVEAYKNMRYEDLIAPAIKAIQELKAENDSLKARIEALEAKIK